MKNILFALLALFVCLSNTACSTAEPGAGHEAVLVKKPMFFGKGGIDANPVKTGLVYTAPTTEAVLVNMQPRQQEVQFDDLMTSDGVPLDFHAAVQYRITDSVKLVRDFGADDGPQGMGFFIRNLLQPFNAIVRDAVKKHHLNEMAINATAAAEVDAEVTARFSEVIAKSGAPVTLLGISLGRANPPDAIKHQRIATAEQQQRQKTEQEGKLAEDQRKAHEESRAAADKAYIEKMGLNPEQYLALEQIKMLHAVCAGGKCTFISGGVTPTLDIKR